MIEADGLISPGAPHDDREEAQDQSIRPKTLTDDLAQPAVRDFLAAAEGFRKRANWA